MDSYKEKVKAAYQNFAKRYAVANFDVILQYQLTEFLSNVRKGKVLDLGCGPGRDTDYLKDEGLEVTGIDFSSEMISLAKEYVDKKLFKEADFDDELFEEGEFDGIWANASLIHVPKSSMLDTIKHISSWLKKGGVMYLNVIEGLGEKEIRIKNFYEEELLVSFYSVDEIIQIVEEAGLSVTKFHIESDDNFNWIDIFCKK